MPYAMDEVPDLVDDPPAIPLPPLVDTPAVVLAGFLGGGYRPLVLDASGVREIEADALDLLASFLRAKSEAGVEAYLICPDRDELGFSPSLR